MLTIDPYADASALPCDGCPEQALQSYLASPAGLLLQVAMDLCFALETGVTVTLAEIPYHVFLVLRALIDERERWKAEEIKKSSHASR